MRDVGDKRVDRTGAGSAHQADKPVEGAAASRTKSAPSKSASASKAESAHGSSDQVHSERATGKAAPDAKALTKNFCSVDDKPSPQEVSREKFRQLRQLGRSFDKFDTAAKGGKADGIVSNEDLQAVADGKVQVSTREKQAAQYFLSHQSERDALDKANKPSDGTDGKISREDADTARIQAFNEIRQNPDAQRQKEVEKQHSIKWDNLEAVRKNLKDNPDLSSYSSKQLQALDVIAQSDPKFAKDLQKSTSDYVNNYTRKFDDLPEDKAFQQLLYDQVVNVDKPAQGNEEVTKAAQDRLKSQLQEKFSQGAVSSLEGKSGDDAVKESLEKFASSGLKDLAKRNPALVPYFQDQAKDAFKSDEVTSKAQEVAEKDDNWLTKGIRWAGDGLGGLIGKVFEIPTPAELGLKAVGLDGAAKFVHNVNGGAGQSVASIVTGVSDLGSSLTEHPIETAKGLADLGLSFGPGGQVVDAFKILKGDDPQEILQHKQDLASNLWTSFTSGYKATSKKYGTEGAVAHVLGDVALALASGGTSAEVEGGLKSASFLSKVGDLKVVSSLKDLAVTTKAAQAVENLKTLREAAALSALDDVMSPALRSLVETNISNLEKAAIQSAPTDIDQPEELTMRGPR